MPGDGSGQRRLKAAELLPPAGAVHMHISRMVDRAEPFGKKGPDVVITNRFVIIIRFGHGEPRCQHEHRFACLHQSGQFPGFCLVQPLWRQVSNFAVLLRCTGVGQPAQYQRGDCYKRQPQHHQQQLCESHFMHQPAPGAADQPDVAKGYPDSATAADEVNQQRHGKRRQSGGEPCR